MCAEGLLLLLMYCRFREEQETTNRNTMIDDALVVCILSTYLLRTVDNAARTYVHTPSF